MKIHVQCACGKAVDLPETEAGQTRFCEECGAKFSVPVPVLDPSDAMPCPHCQEPIRRSALKCRHCTKLLKVEVVCPKCARVGRVTPAKLTGIPSCSKCGTKIPFENTPQGIARMRADALARKQHAVTAQHPAPGGAVSAAPAQVRDWDGAKQALTMGLSPLAEQELQDLLGPSERVIYRTRSSARSQVALTDRNLFVFSHGQDSNKNLLGALLTAGQRSLRIVPLGAISAFEIQPPASGTAGHFQVLGAFSSEDDNESKLLLSDSLGYCKAVLLYKAITELQAGRAPV